MRRKKKRKSKKERRQTNMKTQKEAKTERESTVINLMKTFINQKIFVMVGRGKP